MNTPLPLYALAILALVAGIVGLTISMGDTDQSAQNDYKATVIDILEGGRVASTTPRLEPGLLPGLSKLSEAMYCPESACTLASEMKYLYDVTREMLLMLRGDIINPLCRSDDITPPESMMTSQKRICSVLENVFEYVRELEQNAKTARDLLARNEDYSSFKSVLTQLNDRMLKNRTDIQSELEKLRRIEWLAPMFSDGSHAILEDAESPE